MLHGFAVNRMDYQAMGQAVLDDVRQRHTWRLKSRKAIALYDSFIGYRQFAIAGCLWYRDSSVECLARWILALRNRPCSLLKGRQNSV
jgi:hypothetical protein